MSFHHAHPSQNGSSNNFEPLGDLSNNIDHRSYEASTANAEEQRTSNLAIPDEETRFELVSAYLDDEVTAEERQLVAQWIRDDAEVRQTYQQLLMLRQAIRTAPVPEQSPLQQPGPSKRWARSASGTMRWTLICATAIALLGGLSQLGSAQGREHLQEAWQFIKSLPEGTLLELAFKEEDPSANNYRNQ